MADRLTGAPAYETLEWDPLKMIYKNSGDTVRAVVRCVSPTMRPVEVPVSLRVFASDADGVPGSRLDLGLVEIERGDEGQLALRGACPSEYVLITRPNARGEGASFHCRIDEPGGTWTIEEFGSVRVTLRQPSRVGASARSAGIDAVLVGPSGTSMLSDRTTGPPDARFWTWEECPVGEYELRLKAGGVTVLGRRSIVVGPGQRLEMQIDADELEGLELSQIDLGSGWRALGDKVYVGWSAEDGRGWRLSDFERVSPPSLWIHESADVSLWTTRGRLTALQRSGNSVSGDVLPGFEVLVRLPSDAVWAELLAPSGMTPIRVFDYGRLAEEWATWPGLTRRSVEGGWVDFVAPVAGTYHVEWSLAGGETGRSAPIQISSSRTIDLR